MQQEYLVVFLEEADDHLISLNENVLLLEKEPTNVSCISEIFRSAHTFKGMSATMGFTDIAELTHKMENVLDDLRNGVISVTEEIIDAILQCIDRLETMVGDIRNGGNGSLDVKDVIIKLSAINNSSPVSKASDIGLPKGEVENATSDKYIIEYFSDDFSKEDEYNYEIQVKLVSDCALKSVRVYMILEELSKIGQIINTSPSKDLLEKEEFDYEFSIKFKSLENNKEIIETIDRISEIDSVIIKGVHPEEPELLHTDDSLEEHSSNEHDINLPKKQAKTNNVSSKVEIQSIRVNIDKIEKLMNMFEETVIERGRIEELVKDINQPELHERVQRLGSISKDLQSLVLNMRMVPIETVFNRFPRTVRQLSKNLGKQIDFTISGEDTELDRLVIDEIGDPLIHLIRNSVDHGVEMPDVRKSRGKNPKGKVHLTALHSGNNVVIELSDDGNGINKDKVLKKALSQGILTETEAAKLTTNEIHELILAPGFSTADVISDISGRGVGLDVVKTTITKLGGTITVKSEEGIGSTFRIELPLTLSIIQSMLFGIDNSKYAIPIANIIETLSLPKSQIQVINGKEVTNYRDKTIQIISVGEVFKTNTSNIFKDSSKDSLQLIVLKSDDRTYGIVVDEIFGQREIVLKGLGSFFTEGPTFFSGATILGDGTVALIIDCAKITK